ncbi:hypothetical protein [Aneurinibacillus sp. REN35]|uniref:hypothetical protein n=1 Tax=Aneurinibacillus sp. REN35 TaxID=3237286 RepID=UPI0035293F7E
MQKRYAIHFGVEYFAGFGEDGSVKKTEKPNDILFFEEEEELTVYKEALKDKGIDFVTVVFEAKGEEI